MPVLAWFSGWMLRRLHIWTPNTENPNDHTGKVIMACGLTVLPVELQKTGDLFWLPQDTPGAGPLCKPCQMASQ